MRDIWYRKQTTRVAEMDQIVVQVGSSGVYSKNKVTKKEVSFRKKDDLQFPVCLPYLKKNSLQIRDPFQRLLSSLR